MTLAGDSNEGELRGFLQQVFACTADVADSIGRRAADRRFAPSDVVIRQGDSDAIARQMRKLDRKSD